MTTKCPSKACICATLTVWLFIAIIAFIVSGFLYLGPMLRSVRFHHTQCRVETTFHPGQFVCACGSSCQSSYPCVLIHVSLNLTNGESWVVSLYEDENQQTSVLDPDLEEKETCSIKVCEEDKLANRRDVEQFHSRYGVLGRVLPCAYDPWDIRAGAMLFVTPLGMDTFHALFWPSVCILMGILSCVVFCRRCRQHEFAKNNQSGGGESGPNPGVTEDGGGCPTVGNNVVPSTKASKSSNDTPNSAKSKSPASSRAGSVSPKRKSRLLEKKLASSSTDSIGLKLAGRPSFTIGDEALSDIMPPMHFKKKPLHKSDGKGKHKALMGKRKGPFS